MALNERRANGDGNGMVMLLGLAAVAYFFLCGKMGNGMVSNVENVGNQVTTSTEPESVTHTQPVLNYQVSNIADVRKPSLNGMREYLQTMVNLNIEYLKSDYKPMKTLRIKDWDWYMMEHYKVNGGGGEDYVTMDQYMQLLLNKGAVV